jgi:hypothetical protein
MDEQELRTIGGIRITPRVGGGVRWNGSLLTATLVADYDRITIKATWWGSLVVDRHSLISIRPWRYAFNRGIRFEVADNDDIWIFRTFQPKLILDRLQALDWPVSS